MSVAANLTSLPAVGETALLTFEITAEFERPDVRIEADLPAGLAWAQPPSGLEVRAVSSPRPADRGRLNRAAGVISFAAGQTRRFEGRVVASAAGPADIAVRVFAPADQESAAPTDHVYLTVAERGGTSSAGMAGRPDGTTAPGRPGATPAAPELTYKAASRSAAASGESGSPSPAAVSCVTGSWGYVDETGTDRLSMNYGVQVWDKDTFSTNDLIGELVTNGQGAYQLCFDNSDGDGGLADGGQDVFVRFISDNDMWRVQDLNSGQPFHYDTGVVASLADNTTHDFGYLQPGDPLHQRGVQAFDAVDDLWNWIPGDCWDDLDVTCKQLVVNWRWDSTTGTFYDPTPRQVFLLAEDPDSRDVTVHEATHAVMDDVYEFSPVPGAGGPHFINKAANQGMAWVEGFAEWTPVRVYGDPNFTWPDGSFLNLETPKWGTAGWDNGDKVEGRVAGSLIDLSDSTNETPWDRLAEGSPGNVWTTFLNHKSNSLAEFWTQRTADGFNVAPTGGLAALYQNTVDYTFRDPLANNTPVSRPTPVAPHNFSYNTTTHFWSVVAVRPPAGVNYDLRLFDDKAQTVQKAVSNAGASLTDFIAVDSNSGFEPFGDFYPRVSVVSGSGNCSVELAQGSVTLPAATSQSIAMASTKVVAVRDTNLTANVPVTIKVTPGGATQDAELFIVRSTAAAHFQTRLSAFKFAGATGPGGVESITFTPPASGWYGVVLVNKAGSGTYTLQRL